MFGKNRVEEDLERIRRANLPDKYPESDHPHEKKRKKREPVNTEDRIGFKDILAMIIAVLSIVLPYAAVFVAALGLFVWGMTRFF